MFKNEDLINKTLRLKLILQAFWETTLKIDNENSELFRNSKRKKVYNIEGKSG
jgi:hypothetical protein